VSAWLYDDRRVFRRRRRSRTGVEDRDYLPPFRFNGKLDKLTIKLEPPKRTAEEQNFLDRKTQEARNAAQ
jgi:hypothetical protein